MIRKKFKIPSWDMGRDFMKRLSSVLDLSIQEVDSNLRMESENIHVNCFLDDRNFSFITIKIYDESLTDKLQEIIEEFSK
jgi:hypothetical protein